MVAWVFLIFVVAIAASCVRIVREKHVEVIEFLGKYSTTLSPGLNFILPPPFNRVAKVLSLKVAEIKSDIDVKTMDNVFVSIPISVMYQVNEDSAADAFYKLEDPEAQINRWVLASIRAKAAEMNLESLYQDRTSVIDSVSKDIEKKLQEFGFRLETILIDQPNVGKEMESAFNRVVAAKRAAEAATSEGEAEKVKVVAKANAEAEAQSIRASGIGNARKIIAQSYADSIKVIKESGGNEEAAMDLLLSVNRLEALRDIGAKGNMLIVDMNEASTSSKINAALIAKQMTKSQE